ncbi:hypothetical protein CYMTET_51536 [Cymbomonas tetramitiformis]|uniref:Uncharacterized protein n=1 Tax=Cymbomonas tetramitiformis TaxID=36881 RepID=A0AAE0BKU9_9CHLO|nr:hypothetical protein CYMTET_51536 [Cymbomonas tetramitiformis]
MLRTTFLCIFLSSIPAATGDMWHNYQVHRRSYLTVNLVDMRCPSQLNVLLGNPVAKPVDPAIAAGRKLLGIPDDQPFLTHDPAEQELEWLVNDEEPLEGDASRHLLGRPAVMPGAPTLAAWRTSSRKAAVAATEEICTGAPDDRGPGIIFSLHLDVDIPVHTPGPPGMEAPAEASTFPKAASTIKAVADATSEMEQHAAEAGGAPTTKPEEEGPQVVSGDRLVSEGDAEPVILRDDGPPVALVFALMLIIAVCGGVGCMYCLIKGDDQRFKTAKLENEALKAKLASLRATVENTGP